MKISLYIDEHVKESYNPEGIDMSWCGTHDVKKNK